MIIGRHAGIDYGRKRIGLAISDSEARLASPSGVIDGVGTPTDDAERVARWAAEREIAVFVVGLPLNMDGSAGPQAAIARQFAAALRGRVAEPVELFDERLSSFQADEHLAATGLSRAKQKRRRDAIAAQVILQSFLDAGRSTAADDQA